MSVSLTGRGGISLRGLRSLVASFALSNQLHISGMERAQVHLLHVPSDDVSNVQPQQSSNTLWWIVRSVYMKQVTPDTPTNADSSHSQLSNVAQSPFTFLGLTFSLLLSDGKMQEAPMMTMRGPESQCLTKASEKQWKIHFQKCLLFGQKECVKTPIADSQPLKTGDSLVKKKKKMLFSFSLVVKSVCIFKLYKFMPGIDWTISQPRSPRLVSLPARLPMPS